MLSHFAKKEGFQILNLKKKYYRCLSTWYYNKIPQTGYPKHQTFISHSCGCCKVQDKGVSSFVSGVEPLAGFQVTISSLCPPLLRGRGAREREQSSLPLLIKDTNPTENTPPSQPHPNLLISSQHSTSDRITLRFRVSTNEFLMDIFKS